jgi:hypothetical protein
MSLDSNVRLTKPCGVPYPTVCSAHTESGMWCTTYPVRKSDVLFIQLSDRSVVSSQMSPQTTVSYGGNDVMKAEGVRKQVVTIGANEYCGMTGSGSFLSILF